MRCLLTAFFPSNSLETTTISTCLPSPWTSATTTFWAWRASWIFCCMPWINSEVIWPSLLIALITRPDRTLVMGLDTARIGCRGRSWRAACEKNRAAICFLYSLQQHRNAMLLTESSHYGFWWIDYELNMAHLSWRSRLSLSLSLSLLQPLTYQVHSAARST